MWQSQAVQRSAVSSPVGPLLRPRLLPFAQAFNFAFKDTIKGMFPKYNSKTDFWPFFAVNLASGGLAGAGSLLIVYPLDFARTRLVSQQGLGRGTARRWKGGCAASHSRKLSAQPPC